MFSSLVKGLDGRDLFTSGRQSDSSVQHFNVHFKAFPKCLSVELPHKTACKISVNPQIG